jgi:predicted PurR-regulated permease PerM
MKYYKIPYINLVPIILISFILYRVVNNIENVGGLISKLFNLLSYFIWGFGFAYLLNPLMMYFEERFKLKREWVLLIIYTLLIGFFVLISLLVFPVLVRNIVDLIANMPSYITKVQKWIMNLVTTNKYLLKADVTNYMESTLASILKNTNSYIGAGLTLLFGNLINFSNLLLKIVTGIMISLYFLKDKENILSNIKKLFIIFLGEINANKTEEFGIKVNNIFKRFVIGKFLDSILVGIICSIALTILNVQFALIIGTIVGITNMIPYFGGYIGMIPACIITFFYSPFKALEVAIFLLVLGEFDGLFLGPKIIGEKIGLNPLWIILGITLGGGFYGVVGMFLGVPVMAVIKILLQEFMKRNLKQDI